MLKGRICAQISCTWQRVQGPLGKRCRLPPLGLSLRCGWDKKPCPCSHAGLRAALSFWLRAGAMAQLRQEEAALKLFHSALRRGCSQLVVLPSLPKDEPPKSPPI